MCGSSLVGVKSAFLSQFEGFNIPTALKGWVGQAAKRTGALHINCILGQRGAGALLIIRR